MQLPLIHLNGSHGPTMAKDYADAAMAVRLAADAVAKTAPHSRDYYPLSDGKEVYRMAAKEHAARIARMRDIAVDLETLALHCRGRMTAAEAANERTPSPC